MSNDEKRNRRLDACLEEVLKKMDAEEGAIFRRYAMDARSREPGAHEQALATVVTEYVELLARRFGEGDPDVARAQIREMFESHAEFQGMLAVLRGKAVQA